MYIEERLALIEKKLDYLLSQVNKRVPKLKKTTEYDKALFDGIPIYSVPTIPFVSKECTLTRAQHFRRVLYLS